MGRGLPVKRNARAIVAAMLAVSAGLLGGSGANASGPRARVSRSRHRRCGHAYLQPTHRNISRVVAATLCLIAREREAHHLGALHTNGSLDRIAAGQAKDMAIGGYFGDNSLSGVTPWQRVSASRYASGARRVSVAQNIGWGTNGLANPAAIVHAWMHSPPHREIMLTSGYRDIGVGVAPAPPRSLARGAPGATYSVEFAARG
jgi:uncharacterized protein YkwD